MEIGRVDFRPVKSLILNDVLLRDFRNDTLLYCQKAEMKIDSFRFVSRNFSIEEITLNNAYFNLWIKRGEDDSEMNLSVFLDSLLAQQQETPIAKRDKEWIIGLKRIFVRNSRFAYREDEFEPVDYGINWTDVECSDLNFDILNPDFFGENVSMQVDNLSLREKSGFVLKRLKGLLNVEKKVLSIHDIKIVTEKSQGNLKKLQYTWVPGQRDWRYFTSRIDQYYEVEDSYVSFEDLAYFNGRLRGITNILRGKGIVSNTVNRIEGRDLELEFGENSRIEADFKSFGLPYFWTTLFEIDIKNSCIYPADLETFYMPWLDQFIQIPEPLHHLSCLSLDGHFGGTIEDFKLEVASTTEGLKGDVLFEYRADKSEEIGRTQFSGQLNLSEVDMKKLTEISMLGEAEITADYAGELHNGNTSVSMRVQMPQFYVREKKLINNGIYLTYKNDRLKLMSALNDKNLKLHLGLEAEWKDAFSSLNANGQVDVADLNYFGVGFSDGEEKENVAFSFEFGGKQEKASSGLLTVSDFSYTVPRDRFTIPEIVVDMEENNGHYQTRLTSDVADINIEGRGVLFSSFRYAARQMKEFFPFYSLDALDADTLIDHDVDGHYRIENKDINRVLRVISPKLHVSEDARFESRVNGNNARIAFQLTADSIKYGTTNLLGPKVHINGDHDILQVNSSIETIQFGEICNAYNLRNELLLSNKEVDGKLSWSNWEEKTYSGDISAKVKFIPIEEGKYKTRVDINPGVIVMGDSVWKLKKSTMTIEKGNVDIQHFSLTNEEQHMAINGRITEDFSDLFSIKLERLDLSKLNRMLFETDMNVFGIVDGEVHFKNNLLHSDINVSDWGIGKDTIGTLHVRSYWDSERNRLVMNAENRTGDSVPFSVAGHYIPSSEEIDVQVFLRNLDLQDLREYSSNLYKDEKGTLSGDIHVVGNVTQPNFYGYLNLNDISLKMTDLNADFHINDSIFFHEDRVYLKNFIINDGKGNKSTLNGFYNLLNNRYELEMLSDNFLIMNTGPEHNESMYGRVYLSSLIHLSGNDDARKITISASTEGDSELFLPISSSASGDKNNFLHFVNTEEANTNKKSKSRLNTKDLLLNANLSLNDNLKVQIVFDPAIGDVLKASGAGDLKIELGHDGAINMFGEYKLSKGSYALTLGGLLDKSFVLKPGGSITWNGAPYDAAIDVDAVYSLKTSLSELLTSTDMAVDRSTKVPVECILSLNNNISNPTVAFDINFPSVDVQTRSYIQSLFSSQDEKNKQMFSLLMLNRFYKPDYIVGSETEEKNVGYQAGMVTASEMLSNQLSRWLSGINNKFDIGFAYRPGDEITTDEVELALSTQLLNDRISLSVNGNMDVGNAKGENPNNSNNIVGDFDLEFKLNQEGTLKLKAYSHTDEKIIYKNNNETIQGIGVSYQETFDTFKELLHRYIGFFKKKKKTEAE
ncbi:translocation/assembly module TamB [Odoribacter sp. OttesenSCG-928-J03]|nr:translocation/assembly module TamB [Odoribacter sp. OttesenSCG-928-J03]